MCEPGQDAQRLNATRVRLLTGLFARQEKERQRIAHELHEGTLQYLAALALNLDCLTRELASARQTTQERIARARALSLSLIEDVRRLATGLRPPLLDHLGLVAALHSYAETRLCEKGVRICFDASEAETRPSERLETILYRVAEEAINNVADHAEARTVNIKLQGNDGLITLVVDDDGKGFEPAEILDSLDEPQGLGIPSMRERLASVGGSLSVGSAPGEGTRVQVKIPLVAEGKGP